MNDEFYMQLAINKAWKYQLLTYPNPAVGCVILDKNGKILSIAAHKKAGYLHAEPNAIFIALCKISSSFLNVFLIEYKNSFGIDFDKKDIAKTLESLENSHLDANFTYEFIVKNHNNILKGSKAYVTLEPCSHHGKTPPCVSLFIDLKFSEVIIAHEDINSLASGGISILHNAGVSVKIGVCKQSARDLLEPFLSWQINNFSFLKVAMSKNGVSNGGLISNELSRAHMHSLRGVCELLVVGGNTVRIDRPMLDTRLAKGYKNPDILIYSKFRNFDKTIPLFNVVDRNVKISNSIENIDKKFIMYEGASEFLKLARDKKIPNLKWILIYQSSNFKDMQGVSLDINLDKIFSLEFGSDTLSWLRIKD